MRVEAAALRQHRLASITSSEKKGPAAADRHPGLQDATSSELYATCTEVRVPFCTASESMKVEF